MYLECTHPALELAVKLKVWGLVHCALAGGVGQFEFCGRMNAPYDVRISEAKPLGIRGHVLGKDYSDCQYFLSLAAYRGR